MLYDVAIVGAGPAGMSAALFLGRCCRRVLLCDVGLPRNRASRSVNGFLTRDGVPPEELRQAARAELARYETVELRETLVTDVSRQSGGFQLVLADGATALARKLLLATGVVDELPAITGLPAFWGRGVFPCPYCDAYELRGRPLGVLGRGDEALALCRALTSWTDDITLFSDGPTELRADDLAALRAANVAVVRERVEAVEGADGHLCRVLLAGAPAVACQGLFVSAGQHQRSPLLERLGCTPGPTGRVGTEWHGGTETPGLYLAGDASEGVQFAIVAAAEGAMAAFEINRSLVRERFEGLLRGKDAREHRDVEPPASNVR
jgi:thioredoxin reductase